MVDAKNAFLMSCGLHKEMEDDRSLGGISEGTGSHLSISESTGSHLGISEGTSSHIGISESTGPHLHRWAIYLEFGFCGGVRESMLLASSPRIQMLVWEAWL